MRISGDEIYQARRNFRPNSELCDTEGKNIGVVREEDVYLFDSSCATRLASASSIFCCSAIVFS
jgi:hypothetical protein